jgi:hypothetical protein
VFPEFIKRRRADALTSPRSGWFQHTLCRWSLGCACATGMQFIDEQYDVFRLHDLFHNDLEAFLNCPRYLPCNEGADQGNDPRFKMFSGTSVLTIRWASLRRSPFCRCRARLL